MDKCIAPIKTGPKKGNICGANKKVIDIINGKEIPHCNRHRIKTKQKEQNINVVDELSYNLNESLKIEENKKIENIIDPNETNILNELDKQLDNLFNEYGL